MRIETEIQCIPNGWSKELGLYVDPSFPLPSHTLIVYENIYDLIFAGYEEGALDLVEYLVKKFYRYDLIYVFDIFNKILRLKGKDKPRKVSRENDSVSRLKERGVQLNESLGSNVQAFRTLDSYMKDYSKSHLIIIKDFDALVSGNNGSLEGREITVAIKEWMMSSEIRNSTNVAILLTPSIETVPEVIKSFSPKIKVPFPGKDDYVPYFKNIFYEFSARYEKKLEFNCNPVEMLNQMDRHNLSFRDVAYIACKALNENIKLDKNSVKILLPGDNNPMKNFEDLTEEEVLILEGKLNEMVIGQEEAIESICRAIKIYCAEIKDENRPIAVLFFAGATGQGKTYLAQCLAKLCFGSEDCMIRLDMSEYSEKHNAADFVGAPPGYIGFEEGSHFLNKASEMKEGIILLDEFEKTPPEVQNVLLQVFDEGRLTDKRNGKVVNFKNFIFILTSNIGQKESVNVNDHELKKQIIFSCMKKVFAPELIGRFTEIVLFSPLLKEHCLKIAANELKKTINNISSKIGLQIQFDEKAIEFITKKGFDPAFNARPLKRAIKRYFTEQLAELILEKKVKKGDVLRFFISEEKGEAAFEKI